MPERTLRILLLLSVLPALQSFTIPGNAPVLAGYDMESVKERQAQTIAGRLEGLWYYPDEHITLAIERIENEKGYYRLVAIEAEDCAVDCGCVLGYMEESAENDKLRLWLYSGIAGDTLTRPVECVANVENGGQIVADSYFSAPNGADFLTIYDNKLFVGEFHRDGNYDTSETHMIETENGTNRAVTFVYEINNNEDYGLMNLNPVYAISTPSLVQGMVITNDSIILSTSYSLPSSNIYVYENRLGINPVRMTFEDVDNEVDTYILSAPAKTIEAPCMSEEMAIKDGRLYILFENACNKYKYFTRDNFKTAYSIELPTIE